MRLVVRGAAVLAVAASLTLSACGGGNPEPEVLTEPTASPTASTSTASATPTATPTVPTPTIPADAVAFARRYIQAGNHALKTGDTSQWRSMSDASCTFCMQTAESIETFHEKGGSYEGDPSWHVDEVGRPGGMSNVTLSMYVSIEPHKVIARTGAEPKESQARTLLFDFTLSKENGQWKVKDLTVNGG